MKNILVLVLFISNQLFAQEYSVAKIPDSLKQDADAILRMEELNIEIVAIDKAIVKHKYAITILDESADNYSRYSNQYDDLVSLSDINATLYDSNGIKIKSAKRRDIYDVKYNGDNFLSDNRVKAFSFQYKTYPYTVEFEDEQVYNGIYYLPNWSPVIDAKLAVQQSKLTVQTPLDYGLRYKQFNLANGPVINTSKKITYSWELNNFKAIEDEIFMPAHTDVAPNVMLAPSKFSVSGFTGNMNSWNEFGKFQLALNANKNELPANIKQKIHELIDGVKSDEEKTKILYNYLQKNTRYISIQLGIGGWQPLPASFVAEKKYGDCKALSNFMISMLKEAGVKAYYTIIKSGVGVTNGLYDDFPAPFFNHIISCVPLKNDTMWLECTSQSVSAGYTGKFTGNRKALLISDDGGVVVQTPKFAAKNNQELRTTKAVLNDKGDLNILSKTLYSGTMQEERHDQLNSLTEQDRIKELNREFEIPTYNIDKLYLKEVKGKNPMMEEDIEITASSYASTSGKRLFIIPNLFKKERKLPNVKPRKFDIVYRNSYTESDSIEIKIPTGYTTEMMPKNISITNKFGTYKMTYTFDNDIIKTVRYYEQSNAKFPASDYLELVKFYDEMFKADRAKMVLVKKD